MKKNNKTPLNIFYVFLFSLCLVVCLNFLVVPYAKAAFDSEKESDIYLMVGELDSLKVYGLTRISMVDPSIADVTNATEDEIELIGQKVGQTALFLWDQKGKRSIIIHVSEESLVLSKKRLESLFVSAGIHEISMEINQDEGVIILKGDLPEEKQKAFDKIIEPFDKVVFNLVNEEKLKDLVQIDMEVIELSSSFYKSLGIDWSTSGSSDGIVLNYAETMPSTDGSIPDFFKIGQFNRTTSLAFNIDALLEEGKAKILSKPKLIVTNGEQASFLVGGEIPIRTTTSSDGVTEENVEFKQYGVSFGITPTIEKVDSDTKETEKKKIDIDMNVEISDIDQDNAVGDDVAFLTRSVNTKLFLDNRQTIVMAGLIKTNQGETIKKIPYLWRVPVLGMLFQKKSMPAVAKETELVITLTPTILINGKEEFTNPSSAPKVEASGLSAKAEDAFSMQKARAENLKMLEKENFEMPEAYSFLQKDTPAIPEEMQEYVNNVQRLIAQAVVYPSEALKAGREGSLKLELLILQDGTLAFVYVKEPSAYRIFDEYALNAAKSIANYPQFPPGTDLQEVNMVVPIIYSLDNK